MISALAQLGVGTYYLRYYALYLAGVAGLIWLARRPRASVPRAVRLGAALAAGVLLVRLVLFDNPWMLRVYWTTLTTENLGFRQGGVLDVEIRKYRRDIHEAPLANLAVGSSQVGAIFYHWNSEVPHPPVGVYSLAGMKPLDFVLHENAIAAFNPQRIVLYLSAFDMTGSPELFSLPLAPSDPQKMWTIHARLREAGITPEELAPSWHGYVFGQFFPEVRYSFVTRAYARQWFGAAPRPAPASQRLPEFSQYFDRQWLDYNFSFLRDFFAYCDAQGIEILVAEGQINPAALTPEIARLNAEVRARIGTLQLQFPRVSYVPASSVYLFSAMEYQDMTHVLPEAAERYTTKFMPYLRER